MPEQQTDLDRVAQAEARWQEKLVEPRVRRFKLTESPTRFYPPTALNGFDFMEKVGFPGTYPFTAGNSPFEFWRTQADAQARSGQRQEMGATAASRYAGFGTAEDFRDYFLHIQSLGVTMGPNVAFDLPTQCGYDSDSPFAAGEVGRVGVAIDTLSDLQTMFEPFVGKYDIDKVACNFTINAPAAVIMAMYTVMAQRRGVDFAKLRGTPQNDVLKEFVARGTYIFPVRPSLRLFRDTLVFMRERLPAWNVNSIGGYHIREAGATREQDLAYSMANGISYLQEGIDAGLDVNDFAPMFTFAAMGGSMELYAEVAFMRASRRMWARIVKERFGATNPKAMTLRTPRAAHIGAYSMTRQRALNNLSRSVVGGLMGAMSGGSPETYPPYDEALGLGHSIEAVQLQIDARRILMHEAKVADVCDPWAGSYFMESLTDQIEADAARELQKVQDMGGAPGAIDNGYMHKAVSLSAFDRQKRIESLEDLVVGVNCYVGEHELEVQVHRSEAPLYDPELIESAERRQVARLKEVKRGRDDTAVSSALKNLQVHARRDEVNLMPDIIECVSHDATVGEICDALRAVFGEAKPPTL